MRLKLYRASRMADAMARVRRELGADALILASRQVGDQVELTVAVEAEDEIAPPPLDPPHAGVLRFHAAPAGLLEGAGAEDLVARLTARLGFAALPLSGGDPPLLMLGPPGGGKTLTVARLAARLVLQGIAPLVITSDGRRAGAIEQLAAFTRVLNLNLVVANHPVTLGRALARRPDGAPVLIDAPGLDLYDPVQHEEARALIATAAAVPVAVLPAGLDPTEAADLARAHAALGATMMIATKLDLARRLGSVLSAAGAGPLALTEGGIGPGVAEGLVPLTPALLASRLRQAVPDPST
jgi:flagellar biosynthesis protein FlhF